MKFKSLLIIFILSNFLNAEYIIKYNDIELGNIKSLETLNDNYLIIQPTNFLAKVYFKFKKYIIFYSEKPNIKFDDVYFKKDEQNFINLLNTILKEQPENLIKEIKNNRLLKINCSNKKCDLEYINTLNNEIIQKGYILFKNNELFEFKVKNIILNKIN